MCVSCVSSTEMLAANAGLVAVAARPVLQRLAPGRFGADPVAGHRRAVAFLRELDLDPVEVLGQAVVDAADGAPAVADSAGGAAGGYATGSRGRSMRSHPQLAVQ